MSTKTERLRAFAEILVQKGVNDGFAAGMLEGKMEFLKASIDPDGITIDASVTAIRHYLFQVLRRLEHGETITPAPIVGMCIGCRKPIYSEKDHFAWYCEGR